MGGEPDMPTDFDMSNILEMIGPQRIPPTLAHHLETGSKGLSNFFGSVEPTIASLKPEKSSACPENNMSLDSWDSYALQSLDSDEADALLASQESWPFFCCDQVPKSHCSPPKTAATYVDGLQRVLTTYDWQKSLKSQQQRAKSAGKVLLQNCQTIGAVVGDCADTLNSATYAILHKAYNTHRTKGETVNRGLNLLKAEENKTNIRLPPSEVINYFIESYVNHHKPYYACATDLTHPNSPTLQSNGASIKLATTFDYCSRGSFPLDSSGKILSKWFD